jgi:hypothetical protein
MLGCSGEPPPEGSAAGAVASPIIGGTLDMGAHPAVVSIVTSFGTGKIGSECTGTIFQTDVPNGFGYVITAAHCVLANPGDDLPAPTPDEMLIVTGDDYSVKTNVYYVVDFAAEPGANPPNFDLAVIKFKGATAATPTLPLVTTDLDMDLADGQAVEIVGYGATAAMSSTNTKKYDLDTALGDWTVDSITTPGVALYTLGAPAGAMGQNLCSGDSGGPWLRTIAGQQYLVGVSSATAANCAAGAVAARVSTQLAFVNGYVAGGTMTETCDQCANSAATSKTCGPQIQACLADATCAKLIEGCGCAAGDAACTQSCAVMQNANTLGAAVSQCFCTMACPTECATDPSCVASGAGGSGGAAGNAGAGGESGGTAGGGAGEAGAGGSGGGAGADAAGGAAAGGTATAGAGGVSGSGGAVTAGTGGLAGSAGGGAAGASSGTTGGIGGGAGASGTGSDATATNGSSGDSGGCSVPSGGRAPASAAWLLALAAWVAKRRRRG